jgi:NitT/TauT family transport system ATP-binding protein
MREEASMTDAIRLDRVAKRFEARHAEGAAYDALSGFDLAIGEGEFFCLLGPTGCGKSTVMHLVAGFELPTSGRVMVGGRPVTGPGVDRGMVFQSDLALFPWLTVEQNVAFGLEVAHRSAADARVVIERNLELVGLAAHRHKFPRELSGGMKQRVQIARALATDPGILLMDEPFGALDAQTRRRMQDELARIWTLSRKTVLFITHDIGEAIWLADRVGIMTHGPGARLKEVIDIDLPRPRMHMTPEFVRFYNMLDDSIRAESDAMHHG